MSNPTLPKFILNHFSTFENACSLLTGTWRCNKQLIIIEVIIKRKILSIETFVHTRARARAHTHTHTHTQAPAHTSTLTIDTKLNLHNLKQAANKRQDGYYYY